MGGADRPAQQRMAARVARSHRGRRGVARQAEPARAKASVIWFPAVPGGQSGTTVVIATATLALQRRLVARDLPAVTANMDAPVEFTVL